VPSKDLLGKAKAVHGDVDADDRAGSRAESFHDSPVTAPQLQHSIRRPDVPPHELDLCFQVALYPRRGDLVAASELLGAEAFGIICA